MPPFIPRKRRASIPLLDPAKPETTKRKTVDPSQAVPKSAAPAEWTVEEKGAVALSGKGSESGNNGFEKVLEPVDPGPATDSEEEDHDDWEDAIAAPHTSAEASVSHPQPTSDLELTLDRNGRRNPINGFYSGTKGPSRIERQIRLHTHCAHVQYLLLHNVWRNIWACDKEAQQILLKQLPKGILKEVERWRAASGIPLESPKESAASISGRKGKGTEKQSEVDRNQRDWGKQSGRVERGKPDLSRGDPLVRLLIVLAMYWKKRFMITAPGLRKIGYKTPSELKDLVESFYNGPHDPERHGECIPDVQGMRKCARQCQGSRDVGAQLFTSLVRGLGIEARMVASLQPVGFGWAKDEDAAGKESDEEGGETGMDDDKKMADASGVGSPTPIKSKVKATSSEAKATKSMVKMTSSKLGPKKRTQSKPSNKTIDLSTSEDESHSGEPKSDDPSITEVTPIPPLPPRKRPTKRHDEDLLFPTYWTEVISPITSDVFPVDPLVLPNVVAVNPEHVLAFEPRGAKAKKAKQVMAYVVAFSQDGTAKDVTTRYLKKHMWPGKTKGVRIPVEKVAIYNKRGRVKKYEEYDWFKNTLRHYTRSSAMRTAVDDTEEVGDLKVVKPERKVVKDEVDTLQSLKASAEFVLERFLRREEALRPGSTHVRLFQSGKSDKAKEEKVFLRADIVRCLSAESWHKEGRRVKAGEYPLKLVPVRAVTLTRKREVEEAERETGERPMQGLYSWDQTDWIIPPPIKDGKIPKNSYGNIDCFVPSMIPRGAVHIPLRGTVKTCKKLEIDYAEAVTGFEFGNKRAVPVITGVIVAAENEDAVISAWQAEEELKRKKEEDKQEKLVLGIWRKFMIGLRIAERMRQEYGAGDEDELEEEVNPFSRKKSRTTWGEKESRMTAGDRFYGGGFLLDDEDEGEKIGNKSGEVLVNHNDQAVRAASSSKEPSLLSAEPCRKSDFYPQTPVSLLSSLKRKAASQGHSLPQTDGVTDQSDSSPSSLSDLNSLSSEREFLLEKKSRKPGRPSNNQKEQKAWESKTTLTTLTRRQHGRPEKRKTSKSRYFEDSASDEE